MLATPPPGYAPVKRPGSAFQFDPAAAAPQADDELPREIEAVLVIVAMFRDAAKDGKLSFSEVIRIVARIARLLGVKITL